MSGTMTSMQERAHMAALDLIHGDQEPLFTPKVAEALAAFATAEVEAAVRAERVQVLDEVAVAAQGLVASAEKGKNGKCALPMNRTLHLDIHAYAQSRIDAAVADARREAFEEAARIANEAQDIWSDSYKHERDAAQDACRYIKESILLAIRAKAGA